MATGYIEDLEPQEQADPVSRNAATKPKFKIPAGFTDEVAFLAYIRRLFKDDLEFDRKNREAGMEDLEFMVGDQWDSTVRQRRTRARKPILTVNRLPAFIAQLVGNRRLNETAITIIPTNSGTKHIALVRQGLFRDIENASNADRAYDKAQENCVTCGIGNFAIGLTYTNDDVFEQDITIEELANAFSVVWDRTMTDKTGKDAGHVSVVDAMPMAEFENTYPWAQADNMDQDRRIVMGDMEGWFTTDDVRIVKFWRMCTRPRKLALLTDGKTVDITDKADGDVGGIIATNPKTKQPMVRTVQKPYAEAYVVCGSSILEGPYELPISRVPVFRVPGWEINVGATKHRFGIIRFMKDPQRLHNYWRSTIAEKLMMAPRARWMASKQSVAGNEESYRNAHQSDDSLLTYDGEAGEKPEYIPPPQVEAGLLQEANMSVQDLRDVSNLHEAMLGQTSNEVSGKAITARQRIGETGTMIYSDNLNAAIEECGRVGNELIPVAYDTIRTIRTLGPDDKETFQLINDPNSDQSVDITEGRYSVRVTTGPSFVTKRVEATESMLNMVNAAPNLMQFVADLIVENQDWPGAEEIAKRLRTVLAMSPGGSNIIDAGDLTPDEQAKMMQQQQQAQQQQQKQELAQLAGMQVELGEKRARTDKATADALAARAKALLVVHQAGLMDAQTFQARSQGILNLANAYFTGFEAEAEHEGAMINSELRENVAELEAQAARDAAAESANNSSAQENA